METEQTGFVGWIKSRSGLAFIRICGHRCVFPSGRHKAHLLGALPFYSVRPITYLRRLVASSRTRVMTIQSHCRLTAARERRWR